MWRMANTEEGASRSSWSLGFRSRSEFGVIGIRGFLVFLAVLAIGVLPPLASAQDRFFDAGGVRIRYVDQGAGTPVVLVHGYTSQIERAWIETGVLPNLSKDHRVIALDLRGHGKSDKPHDPTSYAELSQDVIRLLDYLHIARAHIVGYSLGGQITAKLLTTNPDRFITATLGGSSGRRGWTAQDDRDAEAAAAELEHGVPYRSLILGIAPADQPVLNDEEVRQFSRTLVATSDPLAHAALMRSLRGLVVSNDQMAAVQVPTLAIVGSADRALKGVNALAAVWPALKVVIIDGATHANSTGRGAAARPEFVNAIREFIVAHI